MIGRNQKRDVRVVSSEKVLEVAASMQGSLVFKDAVNLRINGSFEGNLITKGTLIIGENAVVKADIHGEVIQIAGEVIGDIKADQQLVLVAPGRLVGDMITPSLIVEEGAVVQGKIEMISVQGAQAPKGGRVLMNVDELASYLAVEKTLIFEWADSGKLPAIREGSNWRFDKEKVDEWVASGRIK